MINLIKNKNKTISTIEMKKNGRKILLPTKYAQFFTKNI